jgi:hypothetical protein
MNRGSLLAGWLASQPATRGYPFLVGYSPDGLESVWLLRIQLAKPTSNARATKGSCGIHYTTRRILWKLQNRWRASASPLGFIETSILTPARVNPGPLSTNRRMVWLPAGLLRKRVGNARGAGRRFRILDPFAAIQPCNGS